VVSGAEFYRVDSNGAVTLLGSGIAGTAPVSMAQNGVEICFVNGTQGFTYNATEGLEEIADADFNPANTIEFFSSFFVFDRKGTNQFFISDLLDGETYDGLDFASGEANADKVVAVIRRNDNLHVLGEKSIEIMYSEPQLSVPLQRIAGGTIDRGCIAPLSVILEDNAIWFLGNDRVFYKLDGAVPRRVSTHAIEQAWTGYATVSDAHCFVVPRDGHKFIVVTFPDAEATWVYDVATQRWHERESRDENGESYGRWRGNRCGEAYGLTLIGDQYSGKIGRVDPAVYTEFGCTIRSEATGSPIHADNKLVFFPNFILDIETGVGATTGQGSDPQVMMTYSDDGGHNWATERWASFGARGQRRTRVKWDRLGSARERVFRIAITDPVPRTILAAHSDFKIGSA